ncbi:MAG: alpha/beta fold hydrolase [Candidatus Cloacimonadales bacterium]|nr:alpha/beta fold hydrolase [Candidatus Cloacimonadales bacterium]
MDLKKHNQPISHCGDCKIGVLVIHGITSTTSSMKYLAEKFVEAGFHVELPSLPGHGTVWQELNKVSYQDWLETLENSLAKLQERSKHIFVCGLSLGGALALRLAQLHPEISGLILINHACKFTHPKFWFVPLMRNFIPSTPAVASDIKDPNEKEIAYTRTPTNAVYQMLLMLKEVRRNLPETKQPVIMFKSREDHLVPIISTTYTMKNIGSLQKELIWLENSYHVATIDYQKDFLAEKSIEFIKKNVK